MARVAVLHNTLDFRGGADAVCVHTCAALAEAHEVTLFTASRADPGAVAARFGIDLDVRVRSPPAAGRLADAFSLAAPHVGPQLAARTVLLRAFFERHTEGYDVAVSTANELSLSIPSVQYVHYPQFTLGRLPSAEAGRLNPLWSRLAAPSFPPDRGEVAPDLLSNSAWTADVFEGIYGRRPTVLHPPVDPVADPLPWAERDPGVVLLGRIAPDKRTLDAFSILDRLHERGYDLPLHVVGAAPPAYRDYARRVRRAVAARSYATFEADAPRERVEELLRRNRYGLNTKPEEHFGMALAECVAAGMLAFAPDGGGQVDVLDGDERLLFSGVGAAADRIAAAVDADRRPSLPRDRFGRDRFARAMRGRVEATLA
jgi:glycosyltransferase involved in cell wall biosynthesis